MYFVSLHKSFSIRPPLRGYLLEGQFFIAGVLAGTLTKLAIRYLQHVEEPRSRNVSTIVHSIML